MQVPSIAKRQEALAVAFAPWRSRTLHALLDHAAERFGDRPLVITDDFEWTYDDVAARSFQLARGLVAMGFRPGDKIAIALANYPEFVPLKYAISRAGCVAVPVNILLRGDELKYVLEQSDTACFITMDRFRGADHLELLDCIIPGWETDAGGTALPDLHDVVVFETGDAISRSSAMRFDDIAERGHESISLPEVEPGDPCDILYTSGTTGPPKGVILTHDMMTRTAFGSAYARAFADGNRSLFSLPLYHVFGYVEGMLSVPYVGGAIIPRLRFDAVDTLQAVVNHRATDVLLIPAMSLAMIDEAKANSYDLTSLRCALASGGRAPERLWDQLSEVLCVQEITTGYGMTETTASTTVTRPDDPKDRLLRTNGCLRQVGPAADPQLGGLLVDYRVVDTVSGKVLKRGEVGELQARGIGVTVGYYRKLSETRAAFTADGWLHTGDLGTLDDDGYITLLGRTKESYRCGGEQVLPSEVEDILASHPAVLQAQVVPLPDERMGEIGVAFVVLRDASTQNEEELTELLKSRLARFKIPRHLFFVEEAMIPKTASGRAKKFQLSEIAAKMVAGK